MEKENKGFYLNNKKWIWFVLIGALLIVCIGFFAPHFQDREGDRLKAEQFYWEECKNENTTVSYSKYLLQFPDGKHVDEAKKQLEKLR